MKKTKVAMLGTSLLMLLVAALVFAAKSTTWAEESASQASQSVGAPDQAAVKRARKQVEMLDNIYKQTIVLITDKYVHDDDDYPAGSAAVLLFKRVSESGSHKVRLIDATGEPYEPENVAKDEFERKGVADLKAGKKGFEKVVAKDGKHFLRAVTPVPVVMDKCIMCHAHYADVKEGEPIGAISYTIPIDE